MDYSNLEITYIVTVYQDNKEHDYLNRIANIYSNYDLEVREKIHFVFIDDCSPIPVDIETTKINYTLARVTDDIMWNQGGARNLGVSLSKTSKLILTDLDHCFPENIFISLMKRAIPKHIYRFNRFINGKKINTHLNIFFCSKSTYYKSLGVDEEFAGNYGFEDVYFIELQKFLGTKFLKLRRGGIEVFENKHHGLVRDTKHNNQLFQIKREAIKTRKPFSKHSRRFLDFNWEIRKSNFL